MVSAVRSTQRPVWHPIPPPHKSPERKRWDRRHARRNPMHNIRSPGSRRGLLWERDRDPSPHKSPERKRWDQRDD